MSKGTKAGVGVGKPLRILGGAWLQFTGCAGSLKHDQKRSSRETGTSPFGDSDTILSFPTNRKTKSKTTCQHPSKRGTAEQESISIDKRTACSCLGTGGGGIAFTTFFPLKIIGSRKIRIAILIWQMSKVLRRYKVIGPRPHSHRLSQLSPVLCYTWAGDKPYQVVCALGEVTKAV